MLQCKHASAESGIWNLAQTPQKNLKSHTRQSRVRFQIFLWCLKAKFQTPLSAEPCLRSTPQHLFIDPFSSMNRGHKLSSYLNFTIYKFWDRSGQRQNVFETMSVFVYLRRVFAQTCPSTDSTRWHTRPRVFIDPVSQFISTAYFHFNFRNYSRYKVNNLGPLCLWQCFISICK